MWKDKSRRNIGVDEFQLTSKKFIIHPEYGAEEGVGTHDICLIQTPEYEFGIFEDLSSKFESIPCLPETFDLEKVKTNYTSFLTDFLLNSRINSNEILRVYTDLSLRLYEVWIESCFYVPFGNIFLIEHILWENATLSVTEPEVEIALCSRTYMGLYVPV